MTNRKFHMKSLSSKLVVECQVSRLRVCKMHACQESIYVSKCFCVGLMACWTCCRTDMVNFIHLLMVIYPKWRSDFDILGRFICRLTILKNMVSCEAHSGVTSWVDFKPSSSCEVNNMFFPAWSCIPCDGCPVIQLGVPLDMLLENVHLVKYTLFLFFQTKYSPCLWHILLQKGLEAW